MPKKSEQKKDILILWWHHIILYEIGADLMGAEKAKAFQLQIVIKYTISEQESTAHIRQFPCLIGRDSSAVNFVIMHRTVSRIHAKLIIQDGFVFLKNISTTNRTTINGHYVDSPTKLNIGDKITMGACQLTVDRIYFDE